MKTLIASVFLLSTIFACSNNNNSSAPVSPLAAHQQLLASLSNYENSDTVVSSVFGNTNPPTYSDPNLQKMAAALKNCTFTSDGHNGGTLNGANCPVTFTLTETDAANSVTTNETYNVVDPTFQTYSPVESFTVSQTQIGLASGAPMTISMNVSVTTVNAGTISFSATITSTPLPNGYTFTIQASLKSATDSATIAATVTGHYDSSGTAVIDSDSCAVDNSPVSCSSLGSNPVTTFMTKRVKRFSHRP